MARIRVETDEMSIVGPEFDVEPTNKLDELIPQYAENKNMLEDYKKLCDEENKKIKELMEEGSYEVGGYKATKSIQTRETLNEDKLLDLFKQFDIIQELGIIKTREYIDMNALEAAIYDGRLDNDILLTIDKCREKKDVVTLRINKVKEK